MAELEDEFGRAVPACGNVTGEGRVVCLELGEAEVRELHLAEPRNQDVLGLYIPVDYMLLVKVVESADDLVHQIADEALREGDSLLT